MAATAPIHEDIPSFVFSTRIERPSSKVCVSSCGRLVAVPFRNHQAASTSPLDASHTHGVGVLCLPHGHKQSECDDLSSAWLQSAFHTDLDIAGDVQNPLPLPLVGHDSPITSMCFTGRAAPRISLCTCSSTKIVFYDLERYAKLPTIFTGVEEVLPVGRSASWRQVWGNILDQLNGANDDIDNTPDASTFPGAHHCCFDKDGSRVALCVGDVVVVLEVATVRLVAILDGHLARANAVSFVLHPSHSNYVITVSDDRTFKLWDLSTHSLAYESAVLGTSPLIAVASDPAVRRFCVGTEDGKVLVFSLQQASCPELYRVDLAREWKRLVVASSQSVTTSAKPLVINRSSRSSSSNPSYSLDYSQDVTNSDDVDAAPPVLSVAFSTGGRGAASIVIGTPRGLLLLSAATCKVEEMIPFQDSGIEPTTKSLAVHRQLARAGLSAATAASAQASGVLTCITASAFTPHIHVARLHVHEQKSGTETGSPLVPSQSAAQHSDDSKQSDTFHIVRSAKPSGPLTNFKFKKSVPASRSSGTLGSKKILYRSVRSSGYSAQAIKASFPSMRFKGGARKPARPRRSASVSQVSQGSRRTGRVTYACACSITCPCVHS